MKILLAFLAVPALAGLGLWAAAAATSSLTVFNALVPVDRGVLRIAEDVAYGAGLRQRLDVYAPQDRAGPLPVIVFSYGGAWNSGERGLYDFAGRALAAAGFVTVVYDYRLVPSGRFPAFVEDTAAVIAWSSRNAARFGGDGRRLFLAGHSAGAYNVAMAALDPRYLAAHGLTPAVVSAVAVLSGPFDFLPLDGPATRNAFGHWADLAETQPVNAVTPAAPPFLLVTGDKDRTVYPRNSERLAERLREHGVEARLIVLEGLGHADVLTAIARPLRWRAPVLEAVTGFFREVQASAKRS